MDRNQRPPRIKNLKCVKCGSSDIAQSLKLHTYADSLERDLNIGVADERYGKHSSTIFANVCSNCGHLEMRIHLDEAKLIWEKYRKANR